MYREDKKRMMILGVTGSVGEQALDVARENRVKLTGVSANRNVKRTEEIVREFGVDICAMADESAAADLRARLSDTNTRVLSGEEGICEMIATTSNDVVLNSIIGEAGLKPTLAVIDSGSRLALANKESLVVAGDIVMSRAAEKKVDILPVDSEHSAIFQCLKAGKKSEVKKILLTASGGPFFGYTVDELRDITVEQALAHPTWKMGAKITIDSATLMNKGFEVIEAVHLFGVPADKIEVLIHRQSIIHSMVEYIDNSVIAQLSVPDMRLCAQYALTYPDRCEAVIEELDFSKLAGLSFARPDTKTFALLQCAIDAIGKGGALPAVLNAANEVAVAAFLSRELSFYGITETVLEVVEKLGSASRAATLEEIFEYDKEARLQARSIISKI
ncbi:MAG: 1-deoxy-D-xylulose-5-phosphate reductoisomerase [Ruminococcaceae bacterium]|nr:1-deoxy-D-xylulose-5-phosphate reductoisomerase [Oscillospiraceae bacterium]